MTVRTPAMTGSADPAALEKLLAGLGNV